MQTPLHLHTNLDMGRDIIGSQDATVTVHIEYRRVTRWRLRVGAAFIILGGWITGFRHTTVDITR